MLWATLVLALREIRRHKLRSFLTTLGVIIGIMGIVTMTTLGKGGRVFVEEQIASLGTNAIFIVPVAQAGNPSRSFEAGDVEAVRSEIAGVRNAAGQVQTNANIFYNGERMDTTIEGVGSEYMDVRGIDIDEGRRFTAAEEASGAKVCIIGPTVRAFLFRDGIDPLGQQLRIDRVPCTIIGVFGSRAAGDSNRDLDEWVLMPMEGVQRRFIGSDAIGYIVLSYDKEYASQAIQDALVGLLRERRAIQQGEDPDFDMVDTQQLQELAQSVTNQLTMFVAGIAGISLVVGGIGIMNIMLVSVNQRKREIGIRLAVGAKSNDVQLQFLIEAVLLSCFGGLVGIALAMAISFGLLSLVDIPFVLDPAMYLVSSAICAMVGVVFGYTPARRAARLDPMDVLRQE